MGGAKQLLAWPASGGAKSLVAAAFDAVACVCDTMVVVLGRDAEAVRDSLGDREYLHVESDSDAEMFASVCAGLEAARRVNPHAEVLLQPGDHPEVRRATLDALIQAAGDPPDGCPGRAVMPQFDGQGGHPVLIPAMLTGTILGYNGPGGLRQFWVDRPRLCLRLPVDDPAVVRDIDTPKDYRDGQITKSE